MTLGQRIKAIRKSLPGKITQSDFAKSLGATREMITTYEIDKVCPPEAMIRLICRTYNISYLWLKDGTGPMSIAPETDDERVDALMSGENEFAKKVMRAFARLGDEEWELLRKIVDEIKNAGR
ncbi:helix-turn-helix domain-containing protein [Beduinella massiliensis]|uniref:helix-turn-helix domain-containing protein n=1 Tax=Beduinella massiliensis TaxID=1852363 RepID=UPI000C83445A